MKTQTNKIALITGGSRGLGKSMALRLGRSSTVVILTYKTQKKAAEAVVGELESLGVKAAVLQYDANDVESISKFVRSFKSLLLEKWNTYHFDFLINNAGMGASIPFEDATEELFDRYMNVHFKSVYFLSKQLLPMINKNGRVLNISSTSTQFCVNGYSMYAPMKGAVEVFTRYLAVLAAPNNITVNVIAPGAVETDFNNAKFRNNPELKASVSGKTALGRVGEADDIGGLVAVLCDERSGWVTGQRIDTSGGINLSL